MASSLLLLIISPRQLEGFMKTTDSTVQGYWFAFVVWAFVATLVLFESSAKAQERWIPAARHFAAVEQRRECSVYDGVITKMQRELAHKSELLAYFLTELKGKRAALELCAQEKGIVTNESEEDDVYLASVCGEQYDLWLTPGYRLEMVKQDIDDLKHDLELALGHTNGRCPFKRNPTGKS
jgi:hypothetical protein